MGTILDSVKAMSEKLGVTEEAQTIADQIDLNTEAISGTNPQSRDIAEAVESFNEAMPVDDSDDNNEPDPNPEP